MLDGQHLVGAETRQQSGVPRDIAVQSNGDQRAAEPRGEFVAA